MILFLWNFLVEDIRLFSYRPSIVWILLIVSACCHLTHSVFFLVLIIYSCVIKLMCAWKLSSLKQQFTAHSFCWSGIQQWLTWVVMAQGLSWGCIQTVSWDCRDLKAWLGLKDPLQDGSLTWLYPGGLGSSPCGPLQTAAWGSSHVSWLPPEQVILELEHGGGSSAFYGVLLEGTIVSNTFC